MPKPLSFNSISPLPLPHFHGGTKREPKNVGYDYRNATHGIVGPIYKFNRSGLKLPSKNAFPESHPIESISVFIPKPIKNQNLYPMFTTYLLSHHAAMFSSMVYFTMHRLIGSPCLNEVLPGYHANGKKSNILIISKMMSYTTPATHTAMAVMGSQG